jgi:galactokinase
MADNEVVDAPTIGDAGWPIVEAIAPGRVNLIGDHTDYTGGLVLPFAIDRWTVVRGRPGGEVVHLTSDAVAGEAVVDLAGRSTRPAAGWARYVAAVARELADAGRAPGGFTGTVTSTVPVGAGLASSAALEVALALALGSSAPPATLTPVELAQLCRRAEHRATGTPTGIMDQLVCAGGVAGHALLIDCTSLRSEAVPLPHAAQVVVVASGVQHELASSAYAERVAACARIEAEIGPLRALAPGAEREITVPQLRARARHVLTENVRVRDMVAALTSGDLGAAGALMAESHASLRDDYAVSVPEVDALVDALAGTRGVHGARMTGGGFGGSVVALCEPGALDHLGARATVVRAVGGATVRRRPSVEP